MASLVAGVAFDMEAFWTDGSLAEFFESGDVVTATESSFVLAYADEAITEQLSLTGSFADYVDGVPTTGTINELSYTLNGSVLFTLSGLTLSVEDFSTYVTGDDLAGLFAQILAGADEITGSTGDDLLSGLGGNDVLNGLGGDDVLQGGDGEDSLDGGEGHDTLRGGAGSDQLSGGAGDDFLSEASGDFGPFGNDIYDGGAGNDRVSLFTAFGPGVTVDLRIATAQNTGSMGTDTFIGIEHITANYGDDTLIGNDSGNWFWTFNGTDTLTGNGGDDHFTVGLGTKVLDGGSGADTVEIIDLAFEPAYTADGVVVSLLQQGQAQATGVGNWTLTSIENLSGFYGSDEFTGDNNANILAGEGGNDTLIGGGGNDTLAGDGTFGLSGGNSGAITFFSQAEGAAGNDQLNGGAGNDTLIGGAGNDVLDGGADADQLLGGSGDDIFVVDHAGDIVDETVDEGSDEVRTSMDYMLGANLENLRLTGAAAVDGRGNSLDNILRGNEAANVLLGQDGADNLYGNGGADNLDGGAGDDRLFGGLGNDTLNGEWGYDRMYGGAGDDIYYANDADDYAYENAGEGRDHVIASLDHTLRAEVEDLTLTGTALIGKGNAGDNLIMGTWANNRLYGYEGNDVIVGDSGDDYLLGGGGNDTLIGGAGYDRMYGGTGDDIYAVSDATDYAYEVAGEGTDRVITSINHQLRDHIEELELSEFSAASRGYGNALDNQIHGNSLNNLLYGRDGNDMIFGHYGDDILYGENGGDMLDGGAGLDRFYGGAGADAFIFDDGDFAGMTTASADRIHDFSVADGDTLRLDAVDANANLAGDQAFSFVGTAAFTGTAGELRIREISGNTIVQGDTNGDGLADFWIRLDGLHTLTSSDYVL